MENCILLYRSILDAVLALPDADVKSIFILIRAYAMDGECVTPPPHLAFGWQLIKTQLDNLAERRADIRTKRQAARKQALTNADKPQQTLTNLYKAEQTLTKGNKKEQTLTKVADNKENDNKENDNNIKERVERKVANATNATVDYPHSAKEILEIARNVGVSMTEEEAQYYLDYRSSRDWIPFNSHSAIKVGRIGQDLRIWTAKRSTYGQNARKGGLVSYADGKHLVPAEQFDIRNDEI